MSGRVVDRRAATLGLGAIGFAGVARPAFGQSASIEVIAAGKPGDGDDQLARAVAEGLGNTELLPRAAAVNVEREAQALGEFLDGKRPRATLMVLGLAMLGRVIGAGMGDRLAACRPLARLIGERQPIVVPAGSPYRSIHDLLEAIARDPQAVTWGGRSIGSADHQLALLVTKAAGANPKALSYREADTSSRVSFWSLKGEVPVATGAFIEFASQLRGGTLRALAIASPDPVPGFEIKTLASEGIDVALYNWRGVVSRDAVGQALIDRFGEGILRVSRYPGWLQLLDQRYWANLYDEEGPFERFIADEAARVTALLTEAGAL